MSDDHTGDARLGRDAAVIAGLTAISRLTGFARIVITAAVLGTGLLGDVYQSANTVPNIVFELLAGGALQAALVPLLVAVRHDGGEARFARVTGLVGATVAATLAAVALVIAVAAPLIARVLSSAEPVPAIADDKIALSIWLLIVFAPQIVFYGLGLVSSAALHAKRRFVAAAIAPAVNNLVVIVVYLVFDAMRGDAAPSLDLSPSEIGLLAGGTTLAVIAFTSVPLIALSRSTSERFEPRVSYSDPMIRSMARTGGWAVVQVAGSLALTAAALVIGNGAPGGVAVFALALAVFMLPFALLAAPVATAAMPRLARMHHERDEIGFAALVRTSVARVTWPSAAAALAMGVLAWPIARVVVFGAADERGPAPVAHALMAFAVGVLPYGLHQLLMRVLMSRGQVRQAAGASVITAVAGVALMAVLSSAFDDSERAAALALAHSLAHVVGLLVLAAWVSRSRPVPTEAGVVLQLLGPSTGGIRRHVATLAHDLEAVGWRTVVAAPVGVLEGARDVPVPGGVSWTALRRARGALAALESEVCPAVVHAHGLKAGWVAIGRPGRRVVLTLHNVVLDRGVRGAALRALERHVIRSVDAVIATSTDIETRFETIARRITVVPPVHEVASVTRMRSDVRDELDVDGPLVVTVARLHPQKDLDTLVAAIGIVLGVRSDVSLAIVGDGPERQRITDLVTARGLGSRVRLLGQRSDAVDIMAAADVVVIGSAWESGPLTLLEAGAVSAAVVSTPVGFVPEVVRDGEQALLVPVGEPEPMAAAIMALVDDADRAARLGHALALAVAPRLDRSAGRDAVLAEYDAVRADERVGSDA